MWPSPTSPFAVTASEQTGASCGPAVLNAKLYSVLKTRDLSSIKNTLEGRTFFWFKANLRFKSKIFGRKYSSGLVRKACFSGCKELAYRKIILIPLQTTLRRDPLVPRTSWSPLAWTSGSYPWVREKDKWGRDEARGRVVSPRILNINTTLALRNSWGRVGSRTCSQDT